jgi:WD40 repeat protein/DNA-binding SARP family transcriptional activator
VLGPLSVDNGEAGLGPRDRVVLAALALRPGEVVSVDRLGDALWADAPPVTWCKVVQGCVVRLRRALGQAAIETTGGGYRLTLAGDDLDVCRFERLVERGRVLAATGQPDRAATTLGRALELWRGDPFQDIDGWPAGRNEAVRLAELRRTVEEDILDARLAAGEHREVATEGELLVAEEPLRERRWAILALAQYRSGRQADALRSLGQARRTLVEQLGVEPGAELAALEAAVLRHDDGLAAPPVTAAVSEDCPYKGLVPYDVGDADAFFGRDGEVAACLGRLERTSVLVVAGPSGCGKSSLVRAGLVPALVRAGRTVAMFSPGVDAEGAMTTALASASGTPVVVVDQLEEIFTIADLREAAGPFCRRLADYARDRAPVIVSIRTDHLGPLSADEAFARLVEEGLHLVRPLDGDELRQAIEGPAARAGLRLEHGLVDLLGRDLEGEPGALPLLSHALVETWRRREVRVLTVDGYQATGGIRGAVARSAERLYETLPPDQQKMLRSVLLRLVVLVPEGEPVRSRALARNLAGDPTRDRVVDLLVRARLVTTDEDSLGLAHEALARAWPRLRGWLEESHTGLRLAAQLREAARSWDEFGRDQAGLYRGARLVAVLDAVDHDDITLDPMEQEFLDASRASEEAALTEARAQLHHERSTVRRLRGLLAGVAVLAVLSTGASLVAVDQRGRAQRQSEIAMARELAAAATANLEVDPERSILLALEAVNRSRSRDDPARPEAEEALHRAVVASRIVMSVPDVGGALDWSPDGAVFVTEGAEFSGVVDIRDAHAGDSVRSFRGHDVDVNDVAFNSDGSMLATTGDDGVAKIWDPATGEELWNIEGPPDDNVWGPSFSPDGSLFAASWYGEGVTRLVDLTTGRTIREITITGAGTAFSPDGNQLAIASFLPPTAIVVDTDSGEEAFRLEGHRAELGDVSWSPDGRSIATTGKDGSPRIWDARTGTLRFALHGHAAWVMDVDWSPDSTRLVTASDDGTAKVWRITDGGPRQLLSLTSQDMRTGVRGVAFSPDSTQVMAGDVGITAVNVWDIGSTGDAEHANLPAVPLFSGAAAFAPDGARLVSSTADGSMTAWDPNTGRRLLTFGPDGPFAGADEPNVEAMDPLADSPSGADVLAIDVSPDGSLVAAANANGAAGIWDSETGQEQRAIAASERVVDVAWSPQGDALAMANGTDPGRVTVVDRSGEELAVLREEPGAGFGSVAFSRDGRLLATGGTIIGQDQIFSAEVKVWDWERGEVVRTIEGPADRAVVFNPTRPRIATPADDGRIVEIWNAASGHKTATLTGHTAVVWDVAFAPDGSTLATAGLDGTVRLWDPDTGEQLLVLRGHEGVVTSVAFSPDGSMLASVSVDGTARLWALDLDDLIDIAESELTRTLTDDECGQYLHESHCP